MVAWTRRIWAEYTTALDNNLDNCHLPKNSLFIRCNATNRLLENFKPTKDSSLKNGFYSEMNFRDLNIEDIEVEETEGGVFLRPGRRIKEKYGSQSHSKGSTLYFQQEDDIEMGTFRAKEKLKVSPTLPNHVFTTKKSYAQLGSAYAVGDLNGDGFDDLAVGSAGVYPSGAVYLLYGSDEGISIDHNDIEQVADVTIRMPVDDHSPSSLFGAALATFDLDLDGQMELVVGAPSYKAVDLLYQGRIFIFSVNTSSASNVSIRATIDCLEQFCNLGYSLHADNTSAGPGLVMGAPFAGAGGAQRGAIAFLASNALYEGQENMNYVAQISQRKAMTSTENTVLYTVLGDMDYGWRGYSLETVSIGNVSNFLFGEPGFRDCARSDCAYSPGDNQTVGQVVHGVMDDGEFSPTSTISLSVQFQQLGTRLAMGQPLSSRPNVLAASGPSSDVAGRIFFADFTLEQAGAVYFVTDFANKTAFVCGDRSFGHFGELVTFSDLTNDGLDELIVGAPLWTEHLISGVQEGRVYVYGGGRYPENFDISGDCKGFSIISPCPEKRAYKVLKFGESLARFGAQAISLKSRNKTTLFVTAAHSSTSGRLAGAVGVFDFPH
ncbi:phosphatidylinositol-glycan-specific phospholipase D [Elysia marginata]|uniref:Phosphatidylinositol-glycan-specific phospholipase D n=1 Tax=Elysia marginata TaxID=1093978 RepID=A0AAV4G8T7_9GAST|nr:phosphatidylinositol-glycan-specific phospholipase D [Elysia marginata]